MINTLIGKINKTPDDYNSWVTLARDIVLSGDIKTFRQILMHRSNMSLSGIQLAYETVGWLCFNEKRDILSSLYESSDNHDPFSGAFFLGQAYMELLDFHLDSGTSLLWQGLKRCIHLQLSYPTEALEVGLLENIITNTFLFESEEWTGTKKIPTPVLHPLIQAKTHEPSAYTCVFFCDSSYLLHYAERFLASFRENCGNAAIFVGIINPSQEALAFALQLADRFPPLSIVETHYSGDRMAEYCTAIRFLCANELIHTFNTPTLLLDADSYFPPGSGEILAQIATFPFSYIDTRELLPNLTIAAAVVGAHPGVERTALFDIARTYLMAKLAEDGPLWTVDQVALHRAISFGKKTGFNMKNLRSALPGYPELPSFFVLKHEIPFMFRIEKRTNALFSFEGIAENGELFFTKK